MHLCPQCLLVRYKLRSPAVSPTSMAQHEVFAQIWAFNIYDSRKAFDTRRRGIARRKQNRGFACIGPLRRSFSSRAWASFLFRRTRSATTCRRGRVLWTCSPLQRAAEPAFHMSQITCSKRRASTLERSRLSQREFHRPVALALREGKCTFTLHCNCL